MENNYPINIISHTRAVVFVIPPFHLDPTSQGCNTQLIIGKQTNEKNVVRKTAKMKSTLHAFTRTISCRYSTQTQKDRSMFFFSPFFISANVRCFHNRLNQPHRLANLKFCFYLGGGKRHEKRRCTNVLFHSDSFASLGK